MQQFESNVIQTMHKMHQQRTITLNQVMLTMCTKTTIHCCLFTAASASVFVINYNYLHPQKLTKQETVLKLKCLDNTKIKITKF